MIVDSARLPGRLLSAKARVLMILPAVVLLILFVIEPFFLSLILSFTNLRMGSPLPVEFVGLRQYVAIFSDTAFLSAMFNNGVFALVVVPLQTVLALAIALLLNRELYGRAIFRAIFFMPVIFPLSLISVVWILIYAPGPEALLNQLLTTFSLGAWEAKDFLRDSHYALPAIMLTSIWQGLGFQMIIILAALQAIPAHLYEAASIDGASAVQRFWNITLPQLRPTLVYVALITTILAFRLFDQVQIMTQGGPGNASTSMMYEAVKTAFAQQQVAMASAMTVVLFAVVLLITWLHRRLSK